MNSKQKLAIFFYLTLPIFLLLTFIVAMIVDMGHMNAGRYETVTSRFPRMEQSAHRGEDINIIASGNELRIQRGQRMQRLIPVTAQHFRYPGETIATSAFIEYGGRMYFQDEAGNYMKIDDHPIRRD